MQHAHLSLLLRLAYKLERQHDKVHMPRLLFKQIRDFICLPLVRLSLPLQRSHGKWSYSINQLQSFHHTFQYMQLLEAK